MRCATRDCPHDAALSISLIPGPLLPMCQDCAVRIHAMGFEAAQAKMHALASTKIPHDLTPIVRNVIKSFTPGPDPVTGEEVAALLTRVVLQGVHSGMDLRDMIDAFGGITRFVAEETGK